MKPLFVIVDDVETHAASQFAFIKSPVRIGRSELNDLPLPLPFVSSWHGVIQFDDDEVRYVDLGSTNGSELDGARLDKNVPASVAQGSEVRVGTLRLRFERHGVVTAPARPVTSFDLRVSELNLDVATPPPAPEPAAAAETALVDQALDNAAMELDLLFASYRGAWEHLRSSIEQALIGISGPAREVALSRLAQKYEGLRREPQFRALCGEPEQPEAQAGRGPTTGLVAAFAQSYLPAPDEAASAEGAQRLLARTAQVLEAFGTSYLELRKGHEEFAREMGLRVSVETAVQRAHDPRELLAYLLDLRSEGRPAELQRAFADLMLHQVALLNGVVEGARGLMGRLDPAAVSAAAPEGVWPLRAGSRWRAYEERWHELTDEQEALPSALFGPEFARAYRAVVGQRAEAEGDGAGKPAPARVERGR